jgi:L-alanine-DL-glutamate epimerase-like enolase superfamily enzyme
VKITEIEVIVLGDPEPRSGRADEFSMPSPGGWGVRIRELAFVRILTDDGLVGCSEVFSVPAEVARVVLHGRDGYLSRHLIGEDPIPPERLWSRVYNTVLHSNRRGWQMICIGALDVALWDLYGKAMNRPVYTLLGGAERPGHQIDSAVRENRQVMPYCTIISRAWDRETVLREQIELVERMCSLGYRAVKIEPLRSTPDTIVELTRRAREVIGPDCYLMVDVGCLWNDVGAALQVLRRLEPYDVFFFETPFPVDSLSAYARLTTRTPIRIAAGEHTVSRWEFLDLMDRGGISVIQPYMVTVGGLTEAKRVLEFALPRGVLVIPGNWSTQFQGAAAVQFAIMSPVSPMIEYAPAEIYESPLRRAMQDIGPPVRDGLISPPDAPGIGITLSNDLIKHFRVK